MSLKEYFNKDNIVALLKFFRPEFYNKVTWTIVIAGISIASSSLWEQLINYFLEKELDISFSSNNDGVIGLCFVLIALVYNCVFNHIALKSRSKYEAAIDEKKYIHDVDKFNCLNEIMSESWMEDFLIFLETNHAYDLEKSRVVDSFCRELGKKENRFICVELEGEKEKLRVALTHLFNFLCMHFFFYGKNNHTRLFLYPDLNIDRGLSHYDKESIKLYDQHLETMLELVDKSRDAFERYRLQVKSSLYL